jgi:hypothetical protein
VFFFLSHIELNIRYRFLPHEMLAGLLDEPHDAKQANPL